MENDIYLDGCDVDVRPPFLIFKHVSYGFLRVRTGNPNNFPGWLCFKEAEKLRDFLNYHYPKEVNHE